MSKSAAQLLEQAEAMRGRLEPAVDTYLGGNDAAVDPVIEAKAQEREADRQDDPILREMRTQLAEQAALIKGLLARDAQRPMNELSRETAEFEAQRARTRRYQEIIDKYDGVVTLQIHTHHNLNENWDVKIYINGEEHRLVRGQNHTVPVSVLAALDNARVQSSVSLVDADGTPRRTIIEQLSYPYSIQSMGRGGH